MKSSQDASERWKRVCELSLRLMDSPKTEWAPILDTECDADDDLRSQVLAVCCNYSETDEIFGVQVDAPLTFEDPHANEGNSSRNAPEIPDGDEVDGPTGRME